MVTTTNLSAIDRDALERALAIALASDEPGCREQIESKLRDDDWLDAAETAAYGCQRRMLGLRPWQSPPAFGDAHPGHDGHLDGAALLQRLLDAGLSRWEPDPLQALAKVEARPPAA